jgi:hypothetical protein
MPDYCNDTVADMNEIDVMAQYYRPNDPCLHDKMKNTLLGLCWRFKLSPCHVEQVHGYRGDPTVRLSSTEVQPA